MEDANQPSNIAASLNTKNQQRRQSKLGIITA